MKPEETMEKLHLIAQEYIRHRKAMNEIEGDNITCCGSGISGVQVFRGLVGSGIPLEKIRRNIYGEYDAEYPVEYAITIDGVRFFELRRGLDE